MNAERLSEIRNRLREAIAFSPCPQCKTLDFYAADVSDLLAALGEARGCCPICDAPHGDVHKADCTHMLDRSPGVISAAWATPESIGIKAQLAAMKERVSGQVGYSPIDEVAQRNVMAAMAYAESLPPGDDDDEEEDDIHTPHPHGPDIGTVDRCVCTPACLFNHGCRCGAMGGKL